MLVVSNRQIRSASNSSRSVREMLNSLGYAHNHAGSNTLSRFLNVLGGDTYTDLSSGRRKTAPKSRWCKIRVNR